MTLACPYCTAAAELVTGAEIYPHRPDLANKLFWRCKPCGAWCGCHPAAPKGMGDGTVPLGRLANAELRRAKSAAHAAFDPLWRDGPLKRKEAYAWLAKTMGLSWAQCHIGEFDVEQCQAVVRAVQQRGVTV